jgi:hypothetical protein
MTHTHELERGNVKNDFIKTRERITNRGYSLHEVLIPLYTEHILKHGTHLTVTKSTVQPVVGT